MDDLFPISIILSKLATISENDDCCQLSQKKIQEILMKIEEIQALSIPEGWNPDL